MIADMVTEGSRVADVGCDHGYLSIWLVQAGVSPGVLAMDVRKGPLAAAQEHIAEYGLGDYIETRLSDGLKNCEAGEAETLVCAGMGGRLMRRILRESMEKVKSLKELILQPQSELMEFREFLRRAGFEILAEDAVCEDGKYYFAMKAVYRGEGCEDGNEADTYESCEETIPDWVCDRFGEKLLLERNPVLLQYLLWRRDVLTQVMEKIESSFKEKTNLLNYRERWMRIGTVLDELDDVNYALGEIWKKPEEIRIKLRHDLI